MNLSGTLQGAGGVGGLLMVSEISGSQSTHYLPTYDGNGKVSESLDSSGDVKAHYQYNPFGKTTVANGPKANDFAYRFCTKPLDQETPASTTTAPAGSTPKPAVGHPEIRLGREGESTSTVLVLMAH